MTKFLIAGNWKMNLGPTDAAALAGELSKKWPSGSFSNDVVVSPTAISVPAVVDALKGTDIAVSVQNVHTEDSGAFTGEISTPMVKDAGCKYVIIGHSERREYFGETDELVASKAKKVIADGLRAIVCVGEKLEERKDGSQQKVVKKQLDGVLSAIDSSDSKNFVIAYEPVWAIGTGETASPEQAQEMHNYIRSVVADRWDETASKNVRILYGGSMKPANAEELLSQDDVDGGLIGGASLKADSFSELIEIAESLSK
ncbi:triose-phosphate isomerase [Rhodohalobacter sp. SW132]|uniref:triose-phosphate isomerase n=1 Tax=Rhodohalobacter sp. SW132 TaxID=2293433 RepID=UPI000E237321|nr:triose-phosphate isomerase [Rhodohalobacter sp. SW132]REL38312.1 triose-phosphate isomerase [Rhodohalobacter sp. SW132]